ncbi:hypothetical protein NQ317_004810 [Molorchus minor]|uniref:Cyclic nucleotide-binding domain-containing protein n=1 Tax=Molorchus minor TaxID=1323400 RepID=A0ABQ9JC45_9CUCU|nr:hypothetical protein NQ317_004810 [Molorchus minor]
MEGMAHQYEVTMTNEQCCLILVMIFGRLYTLFLLADLLRLFGIASVSESNYEQQISRLNEYMTSKKSTLSEQLKTELFLFSARKPIKGIPVLATLPKFILGTVVAEMKHHTFSPKDTILKIGTVSENIYFISSGTVAIYNEAGHELYHLEDADEFGIVSIASEGLQRYKLEAIETTDI